MYIPKSLSLSVALLALLCIPRFAQDTASKSMNIKNPPPSADDMRTHREPMRAQIAQMESKTKENMANMDAAAAVKTHMDTMKASMKSEMELTHAMIAQMHQMQMMTDHRRQLSDHMAAMSDQMEMQNNAGKTTKRDTRTPKIQKA